MRFRGSLPIRSVALVAAVLACGKGDPTGPRQPTGLAILTGGNQTGQVGAPLPDPVVVTAGDSKGPIAGVTITATADAQSGGSITPNFATTGADGTVVLHWTLGGHVGPQSFKVSAQGVPDLTVSASATTGPPVAVVATSDAFQGVVVSTTAASRPTVQVTDALGNPIQGVPVSFEVVTPGSQLTGASQVSDAGGVARLGAWTIGPDAVSYTIRATIPGGAAAVFEARGIPAVVSVAAGGGQTANAGTAVPLLPGLRASRGDGSPLPNVPVTFVVTQGGGTVQGASALTGADGVARPVRWILGTAAGNNRLEGQVFGKDPVAFDAVGIAAAPASIAATSATSQSGFLGNYLSAMPAVTVRDGLGNPVAGLPVTFAVTQGNGALSGLAPVTDFQGRAALGSWRLGNAAANTVQATVGSLPPVSFTAAGSAPPASTFRIDVRYQTTPTAGQKAAFDAAVARWTQLIVAGGPPYLVFEVDPSCPSIDGETVDGVVIFANLVPIDGVGRVLGRSGPCILRDEGFLPAEGAMEFDTADLAQLEADGQLNAVILHEMGHVLGFGTIWTPPFNHLLSGTTTGDPIFTGGGSASAMFGAVAPGTTFTGTPVPVEAGGGPGTAFSHWRESTFVNELMTGFLNTGVNPLSAITVQQFKDLGYQVNDAPADAFGFQAHIEAAVAPFASQGFQLLEAPLPGPIVVINRRGGVVARIPRPFR